MVQRLRTGKVRALSCQTSTSGARDLSLRPAFGRSPAQSRRQPWRPPTDRGHRSPPLGAERPAVAGGVEVDETTGGRVALRACELDGVLVDHDDDVGRDPLDEGLAPGVG